MELMMLSKYEPVEALQKENRNGWVDYGDNNQYPNHLLNLYKNSPVHNALVNSIAFMISGKGTNTILDQAIDGISLDVKMHGYFFAEVIWSLDGTRPAKINHLPADECRLAYNEETDEITGIYYSKDWKNWRAKKNTPVFIPFIDPKEAKEQPRQIVYAHIMKTGGGYYTQPDYIGGLNYIELSYQMGLYHVNNILNGLFPSFIVSFVNGIPDKDGRQQIRREWEQMLSGASNAGKFIMTFDAEPSHAPKIEPFPLTDADKQYQYLSEETTRQIMIAHRVTSPLLFGIRDTSGLGSNKDEMTIAMQIFNSQVIEPYQRLIVDAFSAIIPDLAIIPNTPLVSDATPEVSPVAEVMSKKTECPTFHAEQQTQWLNTLESKIEWHDEEEWLCISEKQVISKEEEEEFMQEYMNSMPSKSYSEPDPKSTLDKGLYKVRYAYSQNISSNSREFCNLMVQWSKSGALFRYEDIIDMGNDGVNGDFAPSGESTYDIFTWKGGAFCHHFWVRKVYFRKRKGGKFLPNDGMTNEVEVDTNIPSTIRKEGKEAIAPINTPSRGSLKYK